MGLTIHYALHSSVGTSKQARTLVARLRGRADAALMECQRSSTGEPVAVLCAVNRAADRCYEFVPLATLFSDEPHAVVNPPTPCGGFHGQPRGDDGA